jgi:diguanylate cyclase (GGDEF)-like protein/PAS domain S-box-containing protein
MIQHFIANASILLLCVFGHYLVSIRFHQKPVLKRPYHHLMTGAFFGLAGIFLVSSSVLMENAVRMDLRSIDILIAALLGGPYAAVIASISIAAARFWQGGIYYASIVGVASSLLIGLGNIVLVRKRSASQWRTWAAGYGYTYLVILLTYALVVRDTDALLKVLFYYTLVSLPVTWLCYQLNAQLAHMNSLYSEIHYKEEKYRQLFYSAHDLVYLFSVKDGRPERYLEVNEAAAAALGYTREELLALQPAEVYDPAYLVFMQDSEEWCPLKGQQHIFEWSLEKRDGGFLTVEISGRVFRLQGELVCLAVARDITLRKESEKALLDANRKLEKLSVSDGLTGISNRRGMDLYLRMFWDRGLQHSSPVAVLLLDIDYFKSYNDTYGHVEGDRCLKKIAHVLDTHAANYSGVASRYGGEEFAVVLPETDMETALHAAVGIRRTIEELNIPHSGSSMYGCVTVSTGIAVHVPSENGIEREELLVLADQALYMAKHSGRNRIMAWGQDEAAAGLSDEDAGAQ